MSTKNEPEEIPALNAKERRKLRRQERKAQQSLGHGHLLNPDTERGGEVSEDMNLKGEPGRVGMKRDPASVQPPGQLYACVSWVAPHSTPQRAKFIAMKIRGVFGTKEEALAHAAKVYAADPDFDIHVVDMYEWLVLPPPQEHQMQIPMEYNQAKLDRIMKGYYLQIRKQKQKHDQRVATELAKGKKAATDWRREHGFDTSTSLTKELDPENPERVPVMPKPDTGDGGFITEAAKGSLEAGKAMQAEMEAKGGRTLADMQTLQNAQVEQAKQQEAKSLLQEALTHAVAESQE